jgi:3-hydroxyisobutyrate dehydrogenase
MRRIGFVGIGNMGWPMAANLVAAGFDVTVADMSTGRAAAFAREVGGHDGVDNLDAARAADALITILPTSSHVAAVLREVAGTLAPGAVVIEMSSGDPAVTQALAAKLHDRGVGLVDCPVSGGVARAASGDLAMMLGGDAATLASVMPVLRAMGTSFHHCGGVGAGQAMKALNNLVSAGGFLIGVEALLIGHRFGLEPQRMLEVLNASTGTNNSTQKKFGQFVLSRTFDSGFSLDLMVKDLATAMSIASEGGVTTPFSALCEQIWAGAAHALGPGHDHTEMACFSERIAGEDLG